MKITYLLAGLVVLCAACKSSEKETPNGFKYTVLAKGNDSTARTGQLLIVDFIFRDSKDSVWNESYKTGMPAPVMIQDSATMATENGVMQMFRFLSPGDSVTCSMPIKQFFSEMAGGPVPPGVDTTLTMTYFFKVKDVMEVPEYQAMQAKVAEEKSVKQLESDISAIDAFLAEKGIVAEKAESGLRYVITKTGKGENAKAGQTASVNYVGYLLDGTHFDSNIKRIAEEKGFYNAAREPYGPFEVTIDQSQVIKGWHESLKLINKGAKGTFYIPSTLGWGPRRASQIIGENAITVFDIEILELK
jgi:FKBP-type peptidyl-prolyl cis-trans isomerase FkpA